jgi:hypothetical protein
MSYHRVWAGLTCRTLSFLKLLTLLLFVVVFQGLIEEFPAVWESAGRVYLVLGGSPFLENPFTWICLLAGISSF